MKSVKYVIVGCISAVLYAISLLMTSVICLTLAAVSCLIPFKKYRLKCRKQWLTLMQQGWVYCNYLIFLIANGRQFSCEGPKTPDDEHVVVIANHQSWADILFLSVMFRRSLPPMKFFLKRSLLWQLPLAGWVCWLLGFPFLYRHSKEAIKRNPQLKNKDKDTLRKACQQFAHLPGSLVIYIEGTRFTKEKKNKQGKAFKHLLKPRATGLAVVCRELHCAQWIVNANLFYEKRGMWAFFSGQCGRVGIRYTLIPIDDHWRGDYEGDRDFRKSFQTRLNQLWQENDRWQEEVRR